MKNKTQHIRNTKESSSNLCPESTNYPEYKKTSITLYSGVPNCHR